MHPASTVPALASATLINASPVDYALVALYFVFVLGIGLVARRQVSTRSTSSSPAARCRRG